MRLEIISKHPLGGRYPTPLLFIHGMMHGAWCWDVHFLDYFAQHGFAAHAVNLRGHGASEGSEKTALDADCRLRRRCRQCSSLALQSSRFDRPFHGWICCPEVPEEYDAAGAVFLGGFSR
jgi:pimeloyl-ACP methyl ester carboxylesterase